MLRELRQRLHDLRLPSAARVEMRNDRRELPGDPGKEAVIRAGAEWLCRAQDRSTTQDGGVARHFSLVSGWGPSYPETTGYIVPTMLELAAALGRDEFRARAVKMLDWLASIQMPDGGIQGGTVDAQPRVSVTFNTGQVLMGFAAGVREFGPKYDRPMRRAADWLASTLDADGCWRKHPTPFAEPGEKAYETHVAWGLLEAAKVAQRTDWADAALRNVRWAIGKQQPNGWVRDCCLVDPNRPLTHTLGYFLRGLVEAYAYTRDVELLRAAKLTADGLASALRSDGWLPGRLSPDWSPAVSWVCVTGTSQVAHSWWLLADLTGDRGYREKALRANAFVRRTINVRGNADVRGGVKGAFPTDGHYGRFEYLNWACKFTVDSNMTEWRDQGAGPLE